MNYSPIALFTYNRAGHTKMAVESLLRNSEAKDTDLFVFSDGPKNENAVEGVKKNREYIRTISGFKSITIIERERNWGLANSLIAGITDVIDKYGVIIVVEDDLIVAPYFLKYMNDALKKYKNDNRIACIGSFLNPVVGCDIPETFFQSFFSCWGWATWKRTWDLFEQDSDVLLKKLRWKRNKFNIDNSHNYYGMLYCQKLGLIDSWAIRFYASFFLRGMLQLFPGKTLSIQTGTDGSGSHCMEKDTKFDAMQVYQYPICVTDIQVEDYLQYRKAYSFFLKKMNNSSMFRKWIEEVKSFIRRLIGIDYK